MCEAINRPIKNG